jgi:hypothetical protein
MTGALTPDTVIVNVADPVPAAFVADIDTEVIATVVGVPVICPFDVLTNSPTGRPVALKLVGLLIAVI